MYHRMQDVLRVQECGQDIGTDEKIQRYVSYAINRFANTDFSMLRAQVEAMRDDLQTINSRVNYWMGQCHTLQKSVDDLRLRINMVPLSGHTPGVQDASADAQQRLRM